MEGFVKSHYIDGTVKSSPAKGGTVGLFTKPSKWKVGKKR
jgi:hypothetical protein